MQTNLQHKAVVWSKNDCLACVSVKMLLGQRGYHVEERNIDGPEWTKQDLFEVLPTARSVPQVFIDDNHIGGVDNVRKYLDRIKETTVG